MSKFDKHFCMRSNDAIDYIREKLPNYFGNDELTANEIGDGNINYVFRIENKEGKSIIVKHADVNFRGTTQAVSTDRNRIEAKILSIESELCPKCAPHIYFYDNIMCCVVMEDVRPNRNMRYCMMDCQTFPNFAKDITEFLIKTLLGTTDLVLAPEKKKEYDKEFINPEMCEISERLVLEEPYKNKRGSNVVSEYNKKFVEEELYNDKDLLLAVSKLKFMFQSKSQSLIHGDLHSGSIFVSQESTKVLDPEFAFYAPAGYDIGNVIAHLIYGWARAFVTGENSKYQKWVEDSIIYIVDTFKSEGKKFLMDNCHDIMFKYDEYLDWYIDEILKDSSGYCGTELIRRIVGSAKVKDVTSIEDEIARGKVERLCLRIGKDFIMNADKYLSGKEYIDTMYSKLKEFDK